MTVQLLSELKTDYLLFPILMYGLVCALLACTYVTIAYRRNSTVLVLPSRWVLEYSTVLLDMLRDELRVFPDN